MGYDNQAEVTEVIFEFVWTADLEAPVEGNALLAKANTYAISPGLGNRSTDLAIEGQDFLGLPADYR